MSLGGRTADPGALLQHGLKVNASGNVPGGPGRPHLSHLLRNIAEHPRDAANFTCSSNLRLQGWMDAPRVLIPEGPKA